MKVSINMHKHRSDINFNYTIYINIYVFKFCCHILYHPILRPLGSSYISKVAFYPTEFQFEKKSAKYCSNMEFGCKLALLITYDECHGFLPTYALQCMFLQCITYKLHEMEFLFSLGCY